MVSTTPKPHPGSARNATGLARLYVDCVLEAAHQGDAQAAAEWAAKAQEVLVYILEHEYGSHSQVGRQAT